MPKIHDQHSLNRTWTRASYLGALKVDIIDECQAVSSLGNLISYTQVLKADGVLFGLGSVTMRTHDEEYGVTSQVAPICITVETLKLVAE